MVLKKIVALSDIHIFNNKRFDEHRYIFEKLNEDLEKDPPELILLLGDVVDSKNKLSPEQLVLVRELFIMLSKHSRVAYIIGNHDRTLQTDNRLDSLSTIVSTIENSKNEIVFLEKSQIYDLGYDNCKFAVWSWVENNKAPEFFDDENNEDYIVGLYHGVIDGATTKDGHKLSGEIKLSEFDHCDIVIAGDIHNKTSFRNNEIHYVSSLLQVSVNEDANGGYMTFEWNGKTFVPSRIEIENPKAIETIHIDKIDVNKTYKKNIRIKYEADLYNRKNVSEIVKKLEKNSGLKVFTTPIISKKKNFDVKSKEENKKSEIQDYFKEFLEINYEKIGLKKSDIEKIYELNNDYKTNKEVNFEYGDFKIKSLVINNLLSFGPKGLIIDFDSLEGLVGILGKNRVGKSSIIKILQFVLFNEFPANSLAYSFINKKNKDKVSFAEVIFEKSGKLYKIRREIKAKKNKKTESSVNFIEIDQEGNEITDLNKEGKTATESEIKKYIGLNDYFEILSIFSSQKKQVEFIDCKNAERLKLLNKFLNLQEYEEKETLVKDDLKILKGKIDATSKLIEREYDLEKIVEEKENKLFELKELNEKLVQIDDKVKEINPIYESAEKIYNSFYKKSQEELVPVDHVKKQISDLLNENLKLDFNIEQLSSEKNEKINEISDKEKIVSDIDKKLDFEIEKYDEKFNYLGGKRPYEQKTIEEEKSIAVLNSKIFDLQNQYKIDICKTCGENISEKAKNKIKEQIKDFELEKENVESSLLKIKKQNDESVKSYLVISTIEDELNQSVKVVEEIETEINQINSSITSYKLHKESNNNKILKFEQNILKYDEIFEAKEQFEKIKPVYEQHKRQISDFNSEINELKRNSSIINQEVNTFEKTIEKGLLLKGELLIDEQKNNLLKAYKEIVSKFGLPLFVLNKEIENVNEKINLIVSQIFDFELKFVIDEEKGEVSVQFVYPDDEEHSEVSLASGSETFLINLCVKVGLSQISNLPKITNLFIDEGYDVLDKETISSLPNVFDILKNYYDSIITIVHLDSVKEILDHRIDLIREKGYTKIQ